MTAGDIALVCMVVPMVCMTHKNVTLVTRFSFGADTLNIHYWNKMHVMSKTSYYDY